MIEKLAITGVGVGAHFWFAQPHWDKYNQLSGQAGNNAVLQSEFASGNPPFETIYNYAGQMAENTQAGRMADSEWWSAVGSDVAILAVTALALAFVRLPQHESRVIAE